MKAKSPQLADFGAPRDFGAHVFKVYIPERATEPVRITEYFGFRGGHQGIPTEEDRVHLDRATWQAIAPTAEEVFNARLKAKRLRQARWRTGENLVDRMLGRELCVLAWAAEDATDEQISTICRTWAAFQPEERWWLFLRTVAATGRPEDRGRGWRLALFYALTDEAMTVPERRRPRPPEPDFSDLPLFAMTAP
jgi:hypothetical protein